MLVGSTAQLGDTQSRIVSSAGYSFGALSRLGFGKVLGKFGGRVADLIENVEEQLLALGADAGDEQAGDLLDRGKHLVQDYLRGRGDVHEDSATVVAVVAAHDVVLAFEIVEQRGDGAARDVHSRGDFAGEHGLAFTLDDRERIHCRVREAVPATDRTDGCLDEIADDFEFPGAAAG